MPSEAADFLLAALWPLRGGICVDCAATKVLMRSRDDSLKATKELILNGSALAILGTCDMCYGHGLLTRVRRFERQAS